MSVSPDPHRRSGLILLAIAWLLILGGAYWYFDGWYQRQYNPNPQPRAQSEAAEVVLQRNRDGHYVASGEINGERVTFLLDTGATQVALSPALAARLGVKRGARVTLQTANGAVLAYETRLASVRLGSIVAHDVSAVVTAGMEDEAVLLGMSFLKQTEFTQRNDQLMLRAR